jgi:hypothetical protein
MGPLSSTRITRVPAYSSLPMTTNISPTGLSPSIVRFSNLFSYVNYQRSNWAIPISLAATFRISVDFFSSGYLDVSVLQVRLTNLCIQLAIPDKSGGFPHSDISGSMLICQLPEAFRRLSRPSSPLTAKASAICAS